MGPLSVTYLMRISPRLVFLSLISVALPAEGAVCIGQNCELLRSVVERTGVPLEAVLGEVQGNIIDPIVDSQGNMASWEGGSLDVTPRGSGGGVKVTLWGGTSFSWIATNSSILGNTFNTTFPTGIARMGGSIELPLTPTTDGIINIGFWHGDPGYGSGAVKGTNEETAARLGGGFRTRLFEGSHTSIFLSSGFILGFRRFSTEYDDGKTMGIRTGLGRIGWNGAEKYSDSVAFASLPATLGGTLKAWDLTLSAEGGGVASYQVGQYYVEKFGPAGPFFGTSGYYNIGLASNGSLEGAQLWPLVRIGLEWNFVGGGSIIGNWHPKLGDRPHHIGAGLGWQFLKQPLNP